MHPLLDNVHTSRYKPHKSECIHRQTNAQLQSCVHKDTPNALHLQRDDLLHYQMNYKIFSSCCQCADHILRAPINILVTANLRNLAQYSFLSRCYGRKEILLVRRTRCTAGSCPDKWPFPGFSSSRKGVLESKRVFTVAIWMGKHSIFLLPSLGGEGENCLLAYPSCMILFCWGTAWNVLLLFY